MMNDKQAETLAEMILRDFRVRYLETEEEGAKETLKIRLTDAFTNPPIALLNSAIKRASTPPRKRVVGQHGEQWKYAK